MKLVPLALGACLTAFCCDSLPAQSSPEGFGENTTGGAGQSIVMVTTLADNDPNQAVIAGSLRAALGGGNRRVHFAVGGTITLLQTLEIRTRSNVTVDGSTAPSPGITLIRDQLEIRDSNNIIVRHIRVRNTIDKDNNTPGIVVFKGCDNIWIDHVSVSRVSDESMTAFGGNTGEGRPTNVTFSFNLIADANDTVAVNSGKGMLVSGPGNPNDMLVGVFADRVSIHHNILTNNGERNPQISGNLNTPVDEPLVDIRNNVINRWFSLGTRFRTNATGNLVKNLYVRDPNRGTPALEIDRAGPVFVSGNVSDTNINTLSTSGSAISAPPITEDAVVDLPAALIGDGITTGVGALPRDAVDANIISRFASDMGTRLPTCASLSGTVCVFGLSCAGGTFEPTRDGGSLCCVSGSCAGAPGSDLDADGVEDILDNCVTTYNPAQDDADSDGAGDSCDTCPAFSSPNQADTDGDGIGNVCDNCPALASQDQTDTDSDGAGDVCDLTVLFPLDGEVLCSNLPPTVTFTPKNFDRFKVFLGANALFTVKVTSGKKLLRAPSFPIPASKWTQICGKVSTDLFIKVFGKRAGTSSSEFSEIAILTVK